MPPISINFNRDRIDQIIHVNNLLCACFDRTVCIPSSFLKFYDRYTVVSCRRKIIKNACFNKSLKVRACFFLSYNANQWGGGGGGFVTQVSTTLMNFEPEDFEIIY